MIKDFFTQNKSLKQILKYIGGSLILYYFTFVAVRPLQALTASDFYIYQLNIFEYLAEVTRDVAGTFIFLLILRIRSSTPGFTKENNALYASIILISTASLFMYLNRFGLDVSSFKSSILIEIIAPLGLSVAMLFRNLQQEENFDSLSSLYDLWKKL
jgi:hypothetical protein